jgi:hypothetical protein
METFFNTEKLVSVDSIIEWLKEQIENKHPVDAHTWVNAAQRLTVLLEEEHDTLFTLDQLVAQKRVKLLEEGFTATSAKMHVEASDEYREARKMKARIGRIEELVRLSKVQARMRDNLPL